MQADRIIQRFNLNEEQAEVVQYVASWCHPGSGSSGGSASKAARVAAERAPPVCLCHGPFGSGKLSQGLFRGIG